MVNKPAQNASAQAGLVHVLYRHNPLLWMQHIYWYFFQQNSLIFIIPSIIY